MSYLVNSYLRLFYNSLTPPCFSSGRGHCFLTRCETQRQGQRLPSPLRQGPELRKDAKISWCTLQIS